MTEVLVYLFIPLAGSVFIIGVVFACMREMGTNLCPGRLKKWLLFSGYMIGSVLVSMTGNIWLNAVVIFLLPVIGHFVYNSGRYHLFCYFGLTITLYLTDVVTSVTISILYTKGTFSFVNSESYYVLAVIMARFIEFLGLRIVTGIIRRKMELPVGWGQFLAAVLLPVFSVYNVICMVIFLDLYMSTERLLLFIANVLLLAAVNICFTGIFDAMAKNSRLWRELELQQQKSRLSMEYYRNLEQKYADTRKLVHDIRNHVQAMEHLYQQQESVRGLSYAKDIHRMLNQLGQPFYTGNQMLNILLCDKVSIMQAKGIRPDIKIGELREDFMRDVDITTLFGNLLDNAIEAAAAWAEAADDKAAEAKGIWTEVADGETAEAKGIGAGWVRLRVAAVHSFYSITMENASPVPEKCGENYSGRSRKSRLGGYHEGLGLKNVERVVRQYGGDIQYDWRDEVFTTRIMLEGTGRQEQGGC